MTRMDPFKRQYFYMLPKSNKILINLRIQAILEFRLEVHFYQPVAERLLLCRFLRVLHLIVLSNWPEVNNHHMEQF